MNISAINGKTLVEVTGLERNSEEVRFRFSDGTKYRMFHRQDSCGPVCIEDVCGDPEDIIGLISFAYGTTSYKSPGGTTVDEDNLWTFYTIQGPRGAVVIRWYGTSNGYYSVAVDFEQIV